MMKEWEDPNFQKRLLLFNGALPALLLLYDWARGNLGANPPEALIRTTGILAILFLVLTLCVTPLSKQFHWGWLMRHRRWLGLWCFYYACLHLVAYAFFDRGLVLSAIFKDIQKRPFILLGFLGFLLSLPLAITSTNAMIKKIGGKRWKTLHKLTYLIAPIVALHFWLIVKSDLFYPAIFASALGILLAYRLAVGLLKR